jgi:hypothetical protein
MTDTQIERILAQGKPLAAVLLVRGGWLRAQSIRMRKVFEADVSPQGLVYEPAVWCIELVTEDDQPWHQVYIEAANIVGISVVSYDASNREE